MRTMRADVVGSLLRPLWLLQARQDLINGRIKSSGFTAIADQAATEAIWGET